MRLQSNSYLLSKALMLLFCLAFSAWSAEIGSEKKTDGLGAEILAIFKKAGVEENSLGVSIRDLQTDAPLFEWNADRALSPASTAKILTAYVALKRLGVDYRFDTQVRVKNFWDGKGTLKGDLYVVGSGDPTVTTQSLYELGLQLKKKGLKKIDGSLVFDSSVFDGDEPDSAKIESDSTRPFNAAVSGFNLNENVFRVALSPQKESPKTDFGVEPRNQYTQIRNLVQSSSSRDGLGVGIKRTAVSRHSEIFELNGKISREQARPVWVEINVEHPANYFAAVFNEILAEQGIRVKDSVPKFEKTPTGLESVASLRSAPLSAVVAEMNKSSRNVMADALVKLLGHEVYGTEGSVERGLQVINEESVRLGINSAGFKFVSGSGLTRYNRMSPQHFTRLFHEAFADFDVFPEWLSSLSIAGIDGTLEKKMRGNPAFGRLRGKTGTIDGVSSLVGLVKTRSGRLLSYAAIINVENGSAPQSRKWHDDFGRLLSTYDEAKK